MKPLKNSPLDIIIHSCKLVAKTCSKVNVILTLEGMSEDKARRIFKIAKQSFREVEIISETTGEVLMSRYTSEEWFKPICSVSLAIDTITMIYEGE